MGADVEHLRKIERSGGFSRGISRCKGTIYELELSASSLMVAAVRSIGNDKKLDDHQCRPFFDLCTHRTLFSFVVRTYVGARTKPEIVVSRSQIVPIITHATGAIVR